MVKTPVDGQVSTPLRREPPYLQSIQLQRPSLLVGATSPLGTPSAQPSCPWLCAIPLTLTGQRSVLRREALIYSGAATAC